MSAIMQASPYENVATKGSRAMAHRSRLIALASPEIPSLDLQLKAIFRSGKQIFPDGHNTTQQEFRSQFEARADVLDTVLRIYENALNAEIGAGRGLSYQGVWNAATNSPVLASGVGINGYYYVVGVAGTTNLDGINDWEIGDWAIFNGTVWQKIDNTDRVTSVFGRTGPVVAMAGDYPTAFVVPLIVNALTYTNAPAGGLEISTLGGSRAQVDLRYAVNVVLQAVFSVIPAAGGTARLEFSTNGGISWSPMADCGVSIVANVLTVGTRTAIPPAAKIQNCLLRIVVTGNGVADPVVQKALASFEQ